MKEGSREGKRGRKGSEEGREGGEKRKKRMERRKKGKDNGTPDIPGCEVRKEMKKMRKNKFAQARERPGAQAYRFSSLC